MRRHTRLQLMFLLLVWALWGLLQGNFFQQSAHGQPLTDKQETIVRLYVQTRLCMRSSGIAALRRRLPDNEPPYVQLFMVTVCGDPLLSQLRRDGMAEDDARNILVALARTAYYEDVLGTPVPQGK